MVFCGRVHKEDIEVHFEIPIKGNHFLIYNILVVRCQPILMPQTHLVTNIPDLIVYCKIGGDKIVMKGIFSGEDVHKHCAIAFKTPPFIDPSITQPFKVLSVRLINYY